MNYTNIAINTVKIQLTITNMKVLVLMMEGLCNTPVSMDSNTLCFLNIRGVGKKAYNAVHNAQMSAKPKKIIKVSLKIEEAYALYTLLTGFQFEEMNFEMVQSHLLSQLDKQFVAWFR